MLGVVKHFFRSLPTVVQVQAVRQTAVEVAAAVFPDDGLLREEIRFVVDERDLALLYLRIEILIGITASPVF